MFPDSQPVDQEFFESQVAGDSEPTHAEPEAETTPGSQQVQDAKVEPSGSEPRAEREAETPGLSAGQELDTPGSNLVPAAVGTAMPQLVKSDASALEVPRAEQVPEMPGDLVPAPAQQEPSPTDLQLVPIGVEAEAVKPEVPGSEAHVPADAASPGNRFGMQYMRGALDDLASGLTPTPRKMLFRTPPDSGARVHVQEEWDLVAARGRGSHHILDGYANMPSLDRWEQDGAFGLAGKGRPRKGESKEVESKKPAAKKPKESPKAAGPKGKAAAKAKAKRASKKPRAADASASKRSRESEEGEENGQKRKKASKTENTEVEESNKSCEKGAAAKGKAAKSTGQKPETEAGGKSRRSRKNTEMKEKQETAKPTPAEKKQKDRKAARAGDDKKNPELKGKAKAKASPKPGPKGKRARLAPGSLPAFTHSQLCVYWSRNAVTLKVPQRDGTSKTGLKQAGFGREVFSLCRYTILLWRTTPART